MKTVSEYKKHLAYKLIELRKARQLTQAQISKQLDINIRAYQYYESAKSPREPLLETIIKIATYYDISIDWLLGMKPFKNN